MNTLKNYGLGGVALVIAIFALFLPVPSSVPSSRVGAIQQNQTTYDSVGSQSLLLGANCNNGLSSGCVKGAVIDQAGNTNVGLSFNGVGISFPRSTFANTSGWATTTVWATGQATTTPCSILSPAATSSIQFLSFSITTATSTTVALTVAASSTSAFATTSGSFVTSGSLTGTQSLVWSPITANSGVVPPSSYVVFGLAGETTWTGPGTKDPGFQLSGTCQVEFSTII